MPQPTIYNAENSRRTGGYLLEFTDTKACLLPAGTNRLAGDCSVPGMSSPAPDLLYEYSGQSTKPSWTVVPDRASEQRVRTVRLLRIHFAPGISLHPPVLPARVWRAKGRAARIRWGNLLFRAA